MIIFAIVLVIAIVVIVSFIAFAGQKKKKGEDLGDQEAGDS